MSREMSCRTGEHRVVFPPGVETAALSRERAEDIGKFLLRIGAELRPECNDDTLAGAAYYVTRLLDHHQPTHLIIELGGNDGLRGLGFAQSTENLRQMVQLAEARDITVLLIGVRMPPNFGATYNKRFQQIFETIADEYAVYYLPRFLEGIAANDPALMQADSIHPTVLAQPLLAQKVEHRMRQILNH